MTAKKTAKSKAGMLDNNGRVKNPKTPVSERPAGYAGVGAPSKYRPEYCAQVIEFGRDGFSKAQIAGSLEVTMTTLDEWSTVYPEFSDSLARARVLSQKWWEDAAMHGLVMPQGVSFNATVWAKSVAARFPADYTEKKNVEMSGGLKMTLAEALRESESS